MIPDECVTLTAELQDLAKQKGITLSENLEDDVLIYAQFPQVGLKFLENRNNPDAFEPVPNGEMPAAAPAPTPAGAAEAYTVSVNGQSYHVIVSPEGVVQHVAPSAAPAAGMPTAPVTPAPAPAATTADIPAPLAGNIFKVMVSPGQQIASGDVIMILEAMKMETEVRATVGGTVSQVLVKEGDAVQVGQPLIKLG